MSEHLISTLPLALKVAGISMILLAGMHLPLNSILRWREDLSKLTPINRQIFIVHTVFIGIGILMLGLSCLFASEAIAAPSELGRIASASFAMCWFSRLVCQFVVFRGAITGKQKLDSFLWWAGTFLWLFYTALFAIIFCYQVGVIQN